MELQLSERESEKPLLHLTVDKNKSYAVVDRQEERRHGQADRSRPRNRGPVDHENDRTAAAARLGDCAAYQAAVARRASSPTGIPVSGAAAAGARRLDHRRVGRLREQSPRTLL